MWRHLVLIMTLVLGGALAMSPAHAKKPRPGAGANDKDKDKGEAKRAKLREKVRQMRNARIAAVLDLDEATSAKLFAVFDRYDELIFPLKAEVGKARREVRRLLDDGTSDDAQLNKLFDRIEAARIELERLQHELIVEIRKVLTPRQVAALIVALPEIERDIEKEIRTAAKAAGKGKGGKGAGPGDMDD